MKTQNPKNLIALMLLIFVGQVFSAPFFSCSQIQKAQSSVMMDMHMDSMDSLEMDSMKMDCCGDQCDCPDVMCVSYVFISSINVILSYHSPKARLISNKPALIQKHLISAIFHPPILS